MSDSLYEKLSEYCREDNIPMHMPGHKRNTAAFPYLAALGGALDITEIDSFDDLNEPSSIFAESERLAAELWGSDECIFSVNGSTGALLAAVRAAVACRAGRRVIVARNCHRSVYNALELCAARAEYIVPHVCDLGFAASVRPEDVSSALVRCPDAAAVIITSPTYEGVISDVRAIAELCHANKVPLIVDEAHGAHLSLGKIFPAGAVECSADIVVQSLHKTLPSLTQTAVMHVNTSLVSREELRRQMTVFQTSSPSYLLSASIDGAVRFLASLDGELRLAEWKRSVEMIRGSLAEDGHAVLPESEDGVFAADVSKLILRGGFEMMKRLRRCGIELEMATVGYAVAMTGAGDTERNLHRLATALREIPPISVTSREGVSERIYVPECVMSASEAVSRKSERVKAGESVGRVSARYVYAYPPGIPLVVPGEKICSELIAQITCLDRSDASLRGVDADGMLLCLTEEGVCDEK